MPSRYWSLTPKQAYESPYDYGEQRAFMQEADRLLTEIRAVFEDLNMMFHESDRSARKAAWMLHFDALDAIIDCKGLLVKKRPNTASRLFRDVIETIDLAYYFTRDTPESKADLAKWYEDEIVLHRSSRKAMGKEKGRDAEQARKEVYQDMSRFTHRTYKILLYSYCRGKDDRIWNDSILRVHGQAQPQVTAQYLSVLGRMIAQFFYEVVDHGAVDKDKAREICIRNLGVDLGSAPQPKS